jgi:transposase-like protein
LFAREDSAENGEMRSKKEIRELVEGFAESGMRRREYCAKHGIGMSTLDYWRRTHRKQKVRLMKVEVEPVQAAAGFALVLSNGRRIESSWGFIEADLEKLIRAAEA